MSKTNDGFLPEGYKVPNAGNKYTRFADGRTKLRILQSPIIGNELWVEGVALKDPRSDHPEL